MAYTISRIEWEDIPALESFHHSIYIKGSPDYKDLPMLKWLIKDPFDDNSCNGYVARNEEGVVLGMIVYSINEYSFGDRVVKGVTSMSWLVTPTERGILGIRLLKSALAQADFSFILGGTLMAQKSYSALKLKQIGNADVYTKVLRPHKFATFSGHISRRDIIKALLFFRGKWTGSLSGDMELQPFSEEKSPHTGIYDQMTIIPSRERNRWIMECPVIDSQAFSLVYKGKKMGNCICYIRKGYKNSMRARIVLLPFAGTNVDFYRQAIAHLEHYLAKLGCCSISLFTMNTSLHTASLACGYSHYSRFQGYKVYLRINNEELKLSDFSDWFLSYYESDKGHLYF